MHRLFSILLLVLPFAVSAEPWTCLVVGVFDGDSFEVRCGTPGSFERVRVRINGIDAPEWRQEFGERVSACTWSRLGTSRVANQRDA